jgi:hypothetical protein
MQIANIDGKKSMKIIGQIMGSYMKMNFNLVQIINSGLTEIHDRIFRDKTFII